MRLRGIISVVFSVGFLLTCSIISYASISFANEFQKDKTYHLVGVLTERNTGEPIVGAVVRIGENYLWDVSDENGRYFIDKIYPGTYKLEVSCLGYAKITMNITVDATHDVLDLTLDENSLALEGVMVTAEQTKDGLNTSISLGRNALDHLQMSGMSDISSLLPGGKTVKDPDLTKENPLSLRSGGLAAGNAAFGTAVEVDGVRLNGNASFGGMSGVGTRNVAVDNIESVEIVTGVPSVEYGDLNSGMLKIHTRKGRTPVNVVLSVNPRTLSASLSKGFDLHNNRGIINASGEYVRATNNLASPYTSYTRGNFSVGYSNTFLKALHFEVGFTGNIGGMNSKDDPDAMKGEFEKDRDNLYRFNTTVSWLVNRPGITSLKFTGSVSYNDKKSSQRKSIAEAVTKPAAWSQSEGYFLAANLPAGQYFQDYVDDSKEVTASASLKYNWYMNTQNGLSNNLKAGVQWNTSGNEGRGGYYLDPATAAHGYRPQVYADYPYMHNTSVYLEDELKFPVGRTKVELIAGVRYENLYVKGSSYKGTNSFSPRFNLKWTFSDAVAIRGGWGITEKMPSFYILYPKQDYRDILSAQFSYPGGGSAYVFYTQPFKMEYNPELKWQRNQNAEIAVDATVWKTRISLVGFYNLTKNPYKYAIRYAPFSYNYYALASGQTISSENPTVMVDRNTGAVSVIDNGKAVNLEKKYTNTTFVKYNYQSNGAPVHRAGAELIVDFPEIKPIRTSFRLDASYAYTYYVDDTERAYYSDGWSHTKDPNLSYQYVGIYAVGGDLKVFNGRETHSMDANLTAITHIPSARLIITCRLEMSLFSLSRNLSRYNGGDYAYTVTDEGLTPTNGNIYDGNSYTAIRPIKYMDTDGNIHPFTEFDAANPDLDRLIVKSGNAYTFAQDGYGAYFSANLSVTKEIGDHVSLSFFANNFTNSRMAVTSKATGVSAVLTPKFYYGLTCRLKF